MTSLERIDALAQEIYLARHSQTNDVVDTDLDAFRSQTITWVNQFIPELEKAKDQLGKTVDWNFVRTNDNTIGTISSANVVSYSLPGDIRKLVINAQRDVTIRQDGSTVATFTLVNPNQINNPDQPYDYRDRATQLGRSLIFSRPLKDQEVGGAIVADTISKIPKLSLTDVSLLDILDDEFYDDIRLLFVMGVIKNQILPDIVQGGLSPTYAQKYDRFLSDCITENNASAAAYDQDRENFGWVGGVF